MIAILIVISDGERERLGQLIVRIGQGDGDALSEVYTLAGGRLLSVAVGITRNRAAAEDVLQDSLLKIARGAASFRRGSNGYAWLCTVVRNTALDAVRRERQTVSIDRFYGLAEEGDFTARSENAALVERGMKTLSGTERLAIWLKYFNEMTVREIADNMNLPKSTAQELITRAEKKLRQSFAEK